MTDDISEKPIPRHLEQYTVFETDTLLQAAEQMRRNHTRAVLVVKDDKVLGVLSEGDVLVALLHGSDIRAQVGGLMRVSFQYLENRDMAAAVKLFKKYQFGLLPIVDDDMRIQDVITVADVFAALELKS